LRYTNISKGTEPSTPFKNETILIKKLRKPINSKITSTKTVIKSKPKPVIIKTKTAKNKNHNNITIKINTTPIQNKNKPIKTIKITTVNIKLFQNKSNTNKLEKKVNRLSIS
jgi:hypothetical protein